VADVFVNTLPPRDLLSLQRDLLDLVDQLNTELNTRFVVLDGVAVGTSQTPVAHGLGAVPTFVTVRKFADARVWESQAADANLLYLRASVAVTVSVKAER